MASTTILLRFLAFAVVMLALAQAALAQDSLGDPFANTADEATQRSVYADVPQFGGPSSVGGNLAEDAAVADEYRLQRLNDLFEPWNDFKSRINENYGLQFNVDESILFQAVSESPSDSNAASGLVRIYGQWEPFPCACNCGQLVFKAEDRHRIGTDLTPFDLGFAAGSRLPTGTFFSDFDFSVTNLFWKQYFLDERWAFAVGRIDVTDFVDVYAMINPLTHFLNLAFSTNPSIAVPNQGLGAIVGGMITDQLYMQAGMADANGQPTHSGFNTFFDESEYFSYVEFGATTAQDRIYLDNIHATLWHTDDRVEAGTPEGWGVAISAQRFVCDRWLPFFRFGYSDGDAALMQTQFSTGLGLMRENKDVLGLGLSWGKPSDGTLREQFTSELFYRIQLTQGLAVTPDVQLIVDPARNPAADVLAFFGVRLRAVF